MHIRDLPVLDYYSPQGTGDIASLGPTWQSGYFAATVSIDVVWGGPVTRRINIKDATDGFAGTFAENQASVNWSVNSDSGFSFVSDVGSFATSVPETPGVNGVTAPLNFFAEVGHERNGIFFPAGDDLRINPQRANPGNDAAVAMDAMALLAGGAGNVSTQSWVPPDGPPAETTLLSWPVSAPEQLHSMGTGNAAALAVPQPGGSAESIDQFFADWTASLGSDTFADGPALS